MRNLVTIGIPVYNAEDYVEDMILSALGQTYPYIEILIVDDCGNDQSLEIISANTQKERKNLWFGRQNAFAAMARLSPNVMVGDGTVPRSRLPHALIRVQQILQKNNVYNINACFNVATKF